MHVLKFLLEPLEPLYISVYETIGFGDSSVVTETSVFNYETIGFRDVVPEGISEIAYETIGFDDNTINRWQFGILYETVGFNDSSDEALFVYCEETIGFDDSVEQELSNNIMCVETIGFGIDGFHEMYVEHDITFSWRTRTNAYPAYGYGGAEYGSIVSYGDGHADNLASFEIHIWQIGGPDTNRFLNSNPVGEYSKRLTKQVINIIDTGDPDADASYTLTLSDNKTFNSGEFLSDLEAEIFVKDSDGVYSFPKIIITDTLKVDHEE